MQADFAARAEITVGGVGGAGEDGRGGVVGAAVDGDSQIEI